MQQHNYTYQSDFAKKYVAQGLEEGKKEGRKKGIELGYRELLRDQLQQRFGELPADVMTRLEEADVDTLRAWVRRVLTAGSLADVFAAELR
jgi:flagellar biosynthesis/type III secretory pathway protein FliH